MDHCQGVGGFCTLPTSPGCSDSTIESCVCAIDPYCCNTNWDGICAMEVEIYGCGSCNCCEAHGNEGCVDWSVYDCVCANTPSCCNVAWTATCAGLVTSLGCHNSCNPDWECITSWYNDGDCDCGCNAMDSDCSSGCTTYGCGGSLGNCQGMPMGCDFCW